ncbi:MAG: hypothetical protein JWN17_1924 [Frankiales bacterium]|nr:hypothetical protein [Frankiales bacterium]
MDITDLILADHHRQRLAFAVLDDVDPSDTERLGALWGDLAQFLEVHAAAEEAVFYPELLRLADEGGEETRDAIGDHNEIREAVEKAAAAEVGSRDWWDAVKAARSANTEHMGEEEDDGLPDFRRHASAQLRNDLAVAFETAKTTAAAPQLDTDVKDPDQYVEEHS